MIALLPKLSVELGLVSVVYLIMLFLPLAIE